MLSAPGQKSPQHSKIPINLQTVYSRSLKVIEKLQYGPLPTQREKGHLHSTTNEVFAHGLVSSCHPALHHGTSVLFQKSTMISHPCWKNRDIYANEHYKLSCIYFTPSSNTNSGRLLGRMNSVNPVLSACHLGYCDAAQSNDNLTNVPRLLIDPLAINKYLSPFTTEIGQIFSAFCPSLANQHPLILCILLAYGLLHLSLYFLHTYNNICCASKAT